MIAKMVPEVRRTRTIEICDYKVGKRFKELIKYSILSLLYNFVIYTITDIVFITYFTSLPENSL